MAAIAANAPPMRGAEYLNAGSLSIWWSALNDLLREEVVAKGGDVQTYLQELNPVWRTVGRVTFHLAENKRDPEFPFAFLATYATKLSAQGNAQHLPLGRAMQKYTGAQNRSGLLALLQPIQRAAFGRFAKNMTAPVTESSVEVAPSPTAFNPYAPLRALVRPCILRRLKTDKSIISDLPEKTEVNGFCGLSKQQAALYEQSVRELADAIKQADGIQRRGIVLAYLMRPKFQPKTCITKSTSGEAMPFMSRYSPPAGDLIGSIGSSRYRAIAPHPLQNFRARLRLRNR